MADWVEAYTVPELMEIIGKNAPSSNPGYHQPTQGIPNPQYNQQGQYISQSGKNKTTAGLLTILLGGFGAQYFYVGKAGAGVLSLVIWLIIVPVIGLVTCGAGFILYVIPLIQGIVILTMSDEEFDRKYVYSNSFMPF